MNYLKDKRLYFSSPIECCEEKEKNWRQPIIEKLKNQYGLNVFDPYSDPKQQFTDDIKKAKENKDFQTVRKIARSFVKKDLNLVDRSDILLAYIPYRVPTTGVCHEIIVSSNSKKPTLLVTNMNDISYIPTWYFGFIPVEFMFSNWEALFNYLKEVNEGKHKDNDKWSYIYELI